MSEYIVVNKTILEKRIEELESACIELFNLVHDSEGRIEYKIRANELYDIAQHKEIKSTPLIPEIENAFDAGFTFGSADALFWHTDRMTRNEYESKQDKDDYISNLKLDI